uniref:Uncharacterized protein n=1 Tax=Myoviridae sp. ctshb19 TaxID=2825194 RepID=A0A8S5UGS6_9CAUD|nr:MAG TPA: hypothetical protein [Myoviridae sp. ctshb19]
MLKVRVYLSTIIWEFLRLAEQFQALQLVLEVGRLRLLRRSGCEFAFLFLHLHRSLNRAAHAHSRRRSGNHVFRLDLGNGNSHLILDNFVVLHDFTGFGQNAGVIFRGIFYESTLQQLFAALNADGFQSGSQSNHDRVFGIAEITGVDTVCCGGYSALEAFGQSGLIAGACFCQLIALLSHLRSDLFGNNLFNLQNRFDFFKTELLDCSGNALLGGDGGKRTTKRRVSESGRVFRSRGNGFCERNTVVECHPSRFALNVTYIININRFSFHFRACDGNERSLNFDRILFGLNIFGHGRSRILLSVGNGGLLGVFNGLFLRSSGCWFSAGGSHGWFHLFPHAAFFRRGFIGGSEAQRQIVVVLFFEVVVFLFFLFLFFLIFLFVFLEIFVLFLFFLIVGSGSGEFGRRDGFLLVGEFFFWINQTHCSYRAENRLVTVGNNVHFRAVITGSYQIMHFQLAVFGSRSDSQLRNVIGNSIGGGSAENVEIDWLVGNHHRIDTLGGESSAITGGQSAESFDSFGTRGSNGNQHFFRLWFVFQVGVFHLGEVGSASRAFIQKFFNIRNNVCAATRRAGFVKRVQIIFGRSDGHLFVLFLFWNSNHFLAVYGIQKLHISVGSSDSEFAILAFHHTIFARSDSAKLFYSLLLVVSHNDDAAQARISFRHGSLH